MFLRFKGLQIVVPHAADADAGNIQLGAGRGLPCSQHVAGHDAKGGDGQGAGAQETAAGQGRTGGVGERVLGCFHFSIHSKAFCSHKLTSYGSGVNSG